jgi:hypothetical protein
MSARAGVKEEVDQAMTTSWPARALLLPCFCCVGGASISPLHSTRNPYSTHNQAILCKPKHQHRQISDNKVFIAIYTNHWWQEGVHLYLLDIWKVWFIRKWHGCSNSISLNKVQHNSSVLDFWPLTSLSCDTKEKTWISTFALQTRGKIRFVSRWNKNKKTSH